MGFFQSLGSKISGAANFLGRKVGAAAQYVGQKVQQGANAAANLADKVPILGSGIGDALRSAGGVGDAITDAGKALVGGHGGLAGVQDAIGRGVDAAKNTLVKFH